MSPSQSPTPLLESPARPACCLLTVVHHEAELLNDGQIARHSVDTVSLQACTTQEEEEEEEEKEGEAWSEGEE